MPVRCTIQSLDVSTTFSRSWFVTRRFGRGGARRRAPRRARAVRGAEPLVRGGGEHVFGVVVRDEALRQVGADASYDGTGAFQVLFSQGMTGPGEHPSARRVMPYSHLVRQSGGA